MVARGALIVFEGLDRAGKSTQCDNVVEYLNQNGRRTRKLRFPGQPPGILAQMRRSSADLHKTELRRLVK